LLVLGRDATERVVDDRLDQLENAEGRLAVDSDPMPQVLAESGSNVVRRCWPAPGLPALPGRDETELGARLGDALGLDVAGQRALERGQQATRVGGRAQQMSGLFEARQLVGNERHIRRAAAG
jgi:hypothetical protein